MFTCNLKWTEITAELEPEQEPHDQQDLVARLFNIKLWDLWQILLSEIFLERWSAKFGCLSFKKEAFPISTSWLSWMRHSSSVRYNRSIWQSMLRFLNQPLILTHMRRWCVVWHMGCVTETTQKHHALRMRSEASDALDRLRMRRPPIKVSIPMDGILKMQGAVVWIIDGLYRITWIVHQHIMRTSTLRWNKGERNALNIL